MPVPSDWSHQLRQFVDEWKLNPEWAKYIGDQTFDSFVLVEQAASWDDFLGWLKELNGSWCFR
jgi:hypothetical protein